MEATLLDWVRSVFETHHDWIESVLGVPADRAITFCVRNNLHALVVPRVLPGVPLAKAKVAPTVQLGERVEAVEFPRATPIMIGAQTVRQPCTCISERKKVWEIKWGDTPVAVRFQGLRGAVVALSLAYCEQQRTNWADVVICRQDEAAAVMELLQQSFSDDSAVLSISGREKTLKKSSWDDLVLEPAVLQLVKKDYESFFEREDWFRRHNLPFRRGYLLHGPPGNGKTSVIRAMLSRPGIHGFTLNFFGRRMDDEYLQFMFDQAFECAPSLIVLEDIDRAFPNYQTTQVRSNISLAQLLNCLDGLATEDGLVVVATANDPVALDPAILKRPGRFDRVVAFPNPNPALRAKYLRKLNPNIGLEDLNGAVADCDGFSFAQLREAYILASQHAYERDQDVTPENLGAAVRTLREVFTMTNTRKNSVGFDMDNS